MGHAQRIKTSGLYGLLSSLLTMAMVAPRALGQTVIYNDHLVTVADGNPDNADAFGNSVAIDGDVMVAGARSAFPYDGAERTGVAYVYRWNGTAWILEQMLQPFGVIHRNFGFSVAIDGDVIVVGARGVSQNGSAYVFRWNGSSWVEEQRLFDPDGDASSDPLFGWSVDVSGDVIVVSSSGTDVTFRNEGNAMIFRWNGLMWVEEQKLVAPDVTFDLAFGMAVAISGDVLVVSALDSARGAGAGAAYAYRWNGTSWVFQQKLLASDGSPADEFGRSVSISNEVVVCGAPRDNNPAGDEGSAYVFRWNGSSWVEEQKLAALDKATGDLLGSSVAIDGDTVVVGALGDDDNGGFSGSAYTFQWDGVSWLQSFKLLAADGEASDQFGTSVAIGGGVVVVGAPTWRPGVSGPTQGAAYVFENVVPTPNLAPVADAGPDDTVDEGTLVTLDASASWDPDADLLTYDWMQVSGTPVNLSDAASATPSFTAPQVGPGGETLVFLLVVDDGNGGFDDDEVVITIQNVVLPPICELAHPSNAALWPPRHKLMPISILGISDPQQGAIQITILQVTQDEPVNGLGDGDTGPDAMIQGSTVLLRAERSGKGNGRVYRITFRARNDLGATCTGSVQVYVPHSQPSTIAAVDDGQIFDSTECE